MSVHLSYAFCTLLPHCKISFLLVYHLIPGCQLSESRLIAMTSPAGDKYAMGARDYLEAADMFFQDAEGLLKQGHDKIVLEAFFSDRQRGM